MVRLFYATNGRRCLFEGIGVLMLFTKFPSHNTVLIVLRNDNLKMMMTLLKQRAWLYDDNEQNNNSTNDLEEPLLELRNSTDQFQLRRKSFTTNEELCSAVRQYQGQDFGQFLIGNWDQQKKIKAIYGDSIGSWDVSQVTDFSSIPFGWGFNEDISKWDVSNAKNMGYMFNGASSFNGDLSKWNVSSVTDMDCMFWGARSFNSDLKPVVDHK
jgi:surface protein